MASLESVKQKIVWAKKHFETLQFQGTSYFQTEPCTVVTDCEPETNRLRVKFTAKPIPESIPLIIGDCLQNLRSALDYLVWELVLTAGNQPSKRNMFIVCETLDAFNSQAFDRGKQIGRLSGVSPEAIAEIERLQPYHHGNGIDKSPIHVLDTLCNINKHRRILVMVPGAHHSKVEFVSSESGHTVQTSPTPRYEGAEVGIGPRPVRLGETVEVKGEFLGLITFNEGTAQGMEIGNGMFQLLRMTTEIVDRFEKFF